MYRIIAVIIIFINGISGFAVNRYTLSGFVRDAKTGEGLIGAVVYIEEMKSTALPTNSYGFYSITVPQGDYNVTAQFIGYESATLNVSLSQNVKLDINLTEKLTELNEVIVTAVRHDENVVKPQMGINKINIQAVKSIPVLLGERDVLKTIQLLPGVAPAGEGSSGFYVRGGGTDQNLILLDEATVYNASHLMGFFSVFNPDAVKDVTLYKGSSPAEFGGRLSSVLNMTMNEGSNKDFQVNGGVGLISSRLSVEGPIVKDKGSFIISGRRTYADLILRGLVDLNIIRDSTLHGSVLYFYDLNAKANYRINDKNRIYLSGYFGKDVLGITDVGINWGNSTATIRWNHLFNDQIFSNTSLIYSNYNYTINNGESRFPVNIISQIRDFNLKEDFQYFPNIRSQVKFGFNSIYHAFVPGTVKDTSSNINLPTLPKKYAFENAVYVLHEFKLNERINVNYGLRLSSFTLLGPGTFYSYDSEGEKTDSAKYRSGQTVKTYIRLEPRLAVDYLLNEESSIKASYSRNTQYLHLLSNSTTGSPTDLWIPSSNNVKPEISTQVSLGYFRNFSNNRFEFSTEVYYKDLQSQIDYVNGAMLNFNASVESQLVYGKGRAYGIEFYLNKKSGRFTGWISYTLARSQRKFPEINNGNYYPAKQDRTHDISVVGILDASRKWTFSATWVYYTGNAVTFPSGKYIIQGYVANYYSSRNGYRMPAYHRMDLAATYNKVKKNGNKRSWTFSVYNAYNRENAYMITFEPSEADPSKTIAMKTVLFKIIPSVTYNFKF
jgi:hypothetical protein